MFPKNQRISKQKEIEAVFTEKLSFYNNYFGLRVRKNQLEQNRYTVIIGKKTAKLAVDRNKIKRRIKSILKQNDKPYKYCYDIILVCLKNSEKLNFQETKLNLEKLLIRLK